MFGSKAESLYIISYKFDNKLRLEFTKLKNGLILDTHNSNFIVQNDILPDDITQKLNGYQDDIDLTFISTLLLSDTTTLVPKELSDKMKYCEIAKFNNEYDIAVLKTSLFETKNFFVKTGVDFVYSAFHLLNNYLEKNICRNELLMLILNDKAFITILNSAGVIIDSKIIDLPSYETVKSTHFYDDELEAQKLFREVYYLELNDTIQNAINELYSKQNSFFVEKVTMLYQTKQLENKEIKKLEDETLLKVSYVPINIEETLLELSQSKRNQKSFVIPRKKRIKRDFKYIYFIIFLLMIAFGLYKFYTLLDIDLLKEKFTQTKIEKSNSSYILPNHININKRIEQKVKSIFQIIPQNVMIEYMKIYDKTLEMELFSKDESSLMLLRPNLINLFEESRVESIEKDKTSNFKALVLAKEFKLENQEFSYFEDEYLNDEVLSNERVLEQLKIMLPENSIIRYNSTKDDEILTFNYTVNILISSPNEFFELIDGLNSELYSISLNFPINMQKSGNGIEVEFNLDFNQLKN